ncbi:MAG TPA: hypothetical protein VNO30_16620 [Kofleriaceae bacterium]|nr:hypothetical protein [Kofleriaceae bacterium]
MKLTVTFFGPWDENWSSLYLPDDEIRGMLAGSLHARTYERARDLADAAVLRPSIDRELGRSAATTGTG